MKKTEFKKQHIIQLVLSFAILLLIAFISNRIFFRIDLTTEGRYTISDETKTILKKLDDVVYVKVYLDGELPAGLKKLSHNTKEILDEFRVYAKTNIQYEFINPSQNSDIKANYKIYSELIGKGLKPINIKSRDKEGGSSEKIIFPGALITYQGTELPVSILSNNAMESSDENLNNSTQTLEYNLIKAIYSLTNKKITKIAFLEGQGELSNIEVSDISAELSNYFQIDRGAINGVLGSLDAYKAIIIAKPTKPFNEKDKLVLDQYIMHGGKTIWFVDGVNVNTDSLSKGSTFGFINSLNAEDQLFTYGIRINPNLVEDLQCNIIPINTALIGNQPKWTPTPWPYYPLIAPLTDHPITRNLNMVWARYASQIDTLNVASIKKTVLLKTSAYTKLANAPLMISLEEIKNNPTKKEYNKSNQTIAVLLEGKFPSVFRNRPIKDILPGAETSFMTESVPSKMIVVADGDLIANEVKITPKGTFPTPLGYDKYTHQTFGNRDFIANAVNFLADESGLISLRAKEFKLRLLNKAVIRDKRTRWQIINVLFPVLLVISFGIYYSTWRKNRYALKAE